jgi:phosphatidylethanolamine-binding protein (PEBP) family uncharacterized protein
MRRPMPIASAAVLLSTLALALAGCGGASTPKAITVAFKSPALVGASLPALYTCDGKNISPPLEWGAVPSTTRELALFVLGLTPNHTTGGYKTSVEWAVAGVNPALHKLAAGELPPGAHLEKTAKLKTVHYSICPPRGVTKHYQFALYAVPASITVPPTFSGVKLLDLIASPESPDESNAGGAFLASYKRAQRARTQRHLPGS